jgi:protein-disulfide isomerase
MVMKKKRQQQLLIVAGIVGSVIVILAAIIISNAVSLNTSVVEAAALYEGLTRRVSTDGAPLLGDPDAPVTIVEFIDYSCPHCADYHDTASLLIEDYVRDNDARLEVRILAGLDPVGSPLAARAALCAGEQNGFWEMHDELFNLQTNFGRNAFTIDRILNAAERLNLDSAELSSCVTDVTSYQDALQSNVDLAISLDLSGTPSVLLREGSSRPQWIEQNGTRLTGGVSLSTVSAAIDTLLESAE